MKKLIALIFLVACHPSYAADVTISDLPLGSASATTSNDVFPFVNSTTDVTEKMTVWDLINVPAFVDTYAPLASPTFTGSVTAPTFVGALTGTASGNTTYTANQYGVVLSGVGNSMNVLAPASSTSAVLLSGGLSANPSWGTFANISPLTTLGDTMYENATPSPARLAGNTTTTKNFLTQTGTGSVSAAPSWGTIANTDLSGITNTQLSGSAAITNANLASMANGTVKGNLSGSSGPPSDLTAVSTATATSVAVRDTSGNTQANNFIKSLNSVSTAGGTTTLSISSAALQVFTGTLAQTVVLPVASTLSNGHDFIIQNQSTGTITVQTSGTNQLLTLSANQQASIVCVNNAGGTGVASWNYNVTATTAASGTGAKNYLSAYVASTSSGVANTGNGNFELGSTTGWSLGTVGTLTNGLPTGSPTFGSGASGNLSISTVTGSSAIAGNYSLSYVSSAATTQGNMVASSAFNIDTEDQAKVMTVKFYYTTSSGGTNVNYSGTSSNSYAWAAYDVTNSAWLGGAGQFCMTQSSGQGYCTGVFQTAISTQQIRFVVYNVNATAGAATMYFDDFTVGPQTAPIGPAMTDWQTYTPIVTNNTGGITNDTVTGQWRRVGDSIELQVHVAFTGTPATFSSLYVGLPNGYSINTSKINSTTAGTQWIGGVSIINPGVNVYSGEATYNTSTSVELRAFTGASPPLATVISTTSPITFGNGMFIDTNLRLPVNGWSSNLNMSNDTDTRVVAMQVNQAAPTATVTGSGSLVKFTSGVVQDTHGAFSTTSGLYTVPVSGYYKTTVSLAISGTYSVNGNAIAAIAKNSSVLYIGTQSAGSTSQTQLYPYGSWVVYCNAGDTLAPYVAANSVSGAAISSNVLINYFSVERISGPSVIAATESVNMSYADTAGTAIGTGFAVYPFATKLFDSHSAYNTTTGIYTVPVSGKYRVSTSLTTAAVSLSTTQSFTIQIFHNGSAYTSAFALGGGASANHGAVASGTINCLTGDTISVEAVSSVATTGFTTAGYNNLSIERVGN